MKRTTTRTFLPTDFAGPDRTIVVKANGGKVETFAPLNLATDEWIKSGEYTADGVDYFYHGNCAIRCVPSGGAEYAIY